MEVSRALEVNSINEIKILSNVRLIHRRDLNPIYSKDNLHVQFKLAGELRGIITCYLCLDKQEIDTIDKNYIFPLFVEAMNILVGKQLSQGADLKHFKIQLSPPKLSMIPKEINTAMKSSTQYYELELDGFRFSILTEYSIEALS
jgi:hypothetical protein